MEVDDSAAAAPVGSPERTHRPSTVRSGYLSQGLAAQGILRFPGSRQRNTKWARVRATAPPETVISLLADLWDLELPSVVISVTGDAANQVC